MAMSGGYELLKCNGNHYHLMGPPGGVGYHGAADSRKTASFHFS